MDSVSATRPSWLDGLTGSGVSVAIIDSGRDPALEHPGLRPGVGLIGEGPGFPVALSDDDRDRVGHGTACADILLRTASGARVTPIRVFRDTLETSPEVIVAALDWATARGIRVVNLSLGSLLASAEAPLYEACARAHDAGTIVVAAADTRTAQSFPAVFDNTIGVRHGLFPNVHAYTFEADAAVEVAAHGGRIARGLDGERKAFGGSSFAAPFVSALVASWLEHEPGLDLDGVRGRLARHAVPTPQPAAAAAV